jgi:hypothetical protein
MAQGELLMIRTMNFTTMAGGGPVESAGLCAA